MTEQQQKALDELASASKLVTEEACRLRDKINDHSFVDTEVEVERMKQENPDMPIADAYQEAIERMEKQFMGTGRLNYAVPAPTKSVGIKHDDGKTRFHLLIPEFIKGVADVMTGGAQKYSEWNYLHLERERIIDAHHRHMNAYQRGEENDPETGLSHLFHATCCLQMLWALDNNFHGKGEKKCQT